MTRSKRLPENPIDTIGIAPDVIIPFPTTEQLYDKLTAIRRPLAVMPATRNRTIASS